MREHVCILNNNNYVLDRYKIKKKNLKPNI